MKHGTRESVALAAIEVALNDIRPLLDAYKIGSVVEEHAFDAYADLLVLRAILQTLVHETNLSAATTANSCSPDA